MNRQETEVAMEENIEESDATMTGEVAESMETIGASVEQMEPQMEHFP